MLQGTKYKEKNKLINYKLKELEIILHTNNVNDKKSACFYCTYSFEHLQFYIPKSYDSNGYKVYGCFCSPECATAFLFNEHIDSSVKFERYYLELISIIFLKMIVRSLILTYLSLKNLKIPILTLIIIFINK